MPSHSQSGGARALPCPMVPAPLVSPTVRFALLSARFAFIYLPPLQMHCAYRLSPLQISAHNILIEFDVARVCVCNFSLLHNSITITTNAL